MNVIVPNAAVSLVMTLSPSCSWIVNGTEMPHAEVNAVNVSAKEEHVQCIKPLMKQCPF